MHVVAPVTFTRTSSSNIHAVLFLCYSIDVVVLADDANARGAPVQMMLNAKGLPSNLEVPKIDAGAEANLGPLIRKAIPLLRLDAPLDAGETWQRGGVLAKEM